MRTSILLLSLLLAPPHARARHGRRPVPVHRVHRVPRPLPAPVFVPAEANAAGAIPLLAKGSAGSAVLRLQVLLDRARFPVAEIDGRYGANTRRAVAALREARGLPPGEETDAAVWLALASDAAPVVVAYTPSPEDFAGPFTPIPEETAEKAKLPALCFSSPLEALAERFHASPALLTALNAGVPLAAGTPWWVPAVERPPLPPIALVTVSTTDLSVRAFDAGGRLLARYPATVGSAHDPLPLGQWKIKGVARNPHFVYDPDLFWDAEPGDRKTTLPPGPNSPVGVVWIDLDKKHYGIHGTADPQLVGHAASHGCVRLTNWDAWELSQSVSPRTRATLVR